MEDQISFFPIVAWADFKRVFLPAARLWLSGQSPYVIPDFVSPPWSLIPVLPFVLIPDNWAALLWICLSAVCIYASLDMAAKAFGWPQDRHRLIIVALLTLSPWTFSTLFYGQLTPLVMLGLVGSFYWKSAGLSLFLLSLKPHLGILAALIRLVRWIQARAWRDLLVGISLPSILMICSIAFIPASLPDFIEKVSSGTVYQIGSDYMSSTPETLRHLRLSPLAMLLIYGAIGVLVLVFVIRSPNLPMIATSMLLVAPYARNYDYILLALPALYLLGKNYHRWLIIILLLWPLHRLFVGDFTWSWIDIIVPGLFLVLLVAQDRRTVPMDHTQGRSHRKQAGKEAL